MMSPMERLVATIKGEPTDRIPVFCNLFDQGAGELGMSLEDYYSKGEHVAEAQLRMRDKYGYDNLWSLFFVGKEVEILGCNKFIFTKDGPPNIADFVIKTHEDIHRLDIPYDVSSHPAFEESFNCLRILKKESAGRYPICAYITSSMSLPTMLMGMEKWMELLLIGPVELRDELLTKCSEFFRKEVEAYRKAGADIIVYSNPFGSTDFVSMKQFHDLSMPWIERDLKPVGIDGIVYYCGLARINPVIGEVLERTGIGAYYPSPLDDIAEAKRIIAGRALCAGVINDILLIDWPVSEIKREVKRVVEAGKTGGKFLFGTGAMPLAIPEESIRAMLEAAFEFGRFD